MSRLFLLVMLSVVLTQGFSTVIYEKINDDTFVTEFSIDNPFGKSNIILEMQGMTAPEFVVQTEDLKESVAHTVNFDELSYLQCGTLIDDLLFYNIEGREYFPEDLGGDTLQIGFRFPSVGTTFYYGWMRVKLGPNGSTFRLLGYAYENEVNESISMCDVGMVSIGNDSKQGVNGVYPNPATDFLFVSGDQKKASIELIEIFNLEGQRLKSSMNQNSIEIIDLLPGMYICRIQIENKVVIRHFLKQ